jgi:uroporphyrinogen decarboxylase
MFSRDRVLRALNHRPLDRAPRDLWLSSVVRTEKPDEVAEIDARFPSDMLHVRAKNLEAKCSRPKSNADPQVDAWGCASQHGPHGDNTTLAAPPLAGRVSAAGYEPPVELLDPARFANVDATCEGTGRFVLATSDVRPANRLRLLYGPDAAVNELCDGNNDVRALLARLHVFFLKEIETWAKTQVDGVVLGEDLTWLSGSGGRLKIWRTLFKPLFRDYCNMLHRHDKFAFFLSDGACGDALEDLAEIGIDAVHAQWPPDEFERAAARYRGRLTFWGGVERKTVEPPSHSSGVREAVLRIRKAADFGGGGLISQLLWDCQTPLENIVAYFEEWLIPLAVTI